MDEVADFDAALAALAVKAGLGEDFAAVQRTLADLPWFAALAGAADPRDQVVSAPAAISVCNRAEPLVLSGFYARQYPGC